MHEENPHPMNSMDQQPLMMSNSMHSGSQRFPSVPTSAAHLADQMETGGAKIEETLTRLNCKYQTLFFISAMGIVFASFIGIFSSFFSFQLANTVNCLFMLCFGFIMMVLDIPGYPRWAARYRQMIRKHTQILTRLTGKALWLFYLGALVAVSIWPSKEYNNHMLLLFIALVTSLFVVGVSILGLLISIRKSLRLEKVRRVLQNHYRNNAVEVYRKYAITDPVHGMQFEEFGRLTADQTQGRIVFDVTDLGIIFNALDENQKGSINEREFCDWMQGFMTYV